MDDEKLIEKEKDELVKAYVERYGHLFSLTDENILTPLDINFGD